ncbi:MAG: sulfite exporter TauE/SafE family protein [Planctomycetes bacterium]|nr:sulfite exporter TauE/SafE family protein [Planctomycetota bacterium]
MELALHQVIVLLLAGVIYGLSKTGMTGLTALLVPLLLAVFTPRHAMGIALPMLVLADTIAIIMLRKSVDWRCVALAVPCALVGIGIGYTVLGWTQTLPPAEGDRVLRLLIAAVITFVTMSGLAIRVFQARRVALPLGETEVRPPLTPARCGFGALVMVVGGVVTMLANNGAPAWVVYLMLFRLEKHHFQGTVAWIAFILNVIKTPVAVRLGFVTAETVRLNAMMIPSLVLGLYAGKMFLNRISQRSYDNVVQGLALLGALYLLISSL